MALRGHFFCLRKSYRSDSFSAPVRGALLCALTMVSHTIHAFRNELGWLMALWTSGGAVGSLLGGAIAKRFLPRRLLRTYASAVVLACGAMTLCVAVWYLVKYLSHIKTAADSPQ